LTLLPAAALSDEVGKSRKDQNSIKADDVREAEQRLSDLGYWTGPVDGKFDEGSRHALIAFQKIEGRKRTGVLTPEEIQALRGARQPAPLEGGYQHIEVDLSRQVLFVVSGLTSGSKILPISSGTGKFFTSEGWTRRAVTPPGRFKVYGKIAGWRKSPLGLLYYPLYIHNGIAIHGNPSVPVYPASHGCIRIPMFAAKQLSDMTPIGTEVVVHEGSALNPEVNPSD
jgi:peptidoglycan hydrolase-like protein with peptidoglycan-binding domain